MLYTSVMSDSLLSAATPLAPADFLIRSASVHGDRIAVEASGATLTYRELARRAAQAAGLFAELGLEPGGRVSVLAPNSLTSLEAHFAVPWAGGVLNALNTRLSPAELNYILQHAGSSVLIVDHSLRDVAEEAVRGLSAPPRVLLAGEPDSEYERRISTAAPVHVDVTNELEMLSLNYTSGTTGRPKGVMYSHRGAYLQALAMTMHMDLDASSSYLWIVPMFHCNGWTFPWAVTAAGGRHVLVDRPEPDAIWRALTNGVTHFGAAPTVLARLAAFADGHSVLALPTLGERSKSCQNGGRRTEVGHAVRQRTPDGVWLRAVHQHVTAAGCGHCPREGPPVAVKHRHDPQV